MKLIVAITQDRDKNALSHALIANGFSYTKLGSTGGFLRQGNTTILIGVADEDLDKVLGLLNENCGATESYMNLPPESVPAMIVGAIPPQAVKARTGGAVAFVMDVERFEKY